MVGLGVERQAHPEPELRVVLEQRVAPRRSAAGRVDRPWRRRQVGAVDRRATRRVGHDHPIAEELADQPDVWRLAAAAARSRELEERLEDLAALDRIDRDQAAVEGRDRLEEVPADSLDVAMVRDRRHVDRLVARVGLALGRADVDADAAAGAVVRGDLDRESMVEQVAGAELLVQEAGRRRSRRRRSGIPSSGSSRADRPSRTCRSRCRSTGPRRGSSGRSPASRTWPSRSGTSRRRAARSPAAGRRRRPSSAT